jgi:hypothetical protein
MKHLYQLPAIAILLGALSLSTYAGDVSCPGAQAAPLSTASGHRETALTSDGEIPSGGMATGYMPNGVTAPGEMPQPLASAGDVSCGVTTIMLALIFGVL